MRFYLKKVLNVLLLLILIFCISLPGLLLCFRPLHGVIEDHMIDERGCAATVGDPGILLLTGAEDTEDPL